MSIKEEKFAVKLVGVLPVLFDRYAGDNDTTLQPEEMYYFEPRGTGKKADKVVCMPSNNIYGMLSSNFRNCATKLKYGRAHGSKTDAVQGFIDIDPINIPFTVNGEEAIFNGFDGEVFGVRNDVARIKKSAQQIIPNPRTRPYINTPWELSFDVTIYDNPEFKPNDIADLLAIGGRMIGIGTWRGRFGKFAVESFDKI